MTHLGRLERVSLREAWKNEAGEFTPWLAKEENLALLGETLNLNLELEGTEKGVGPYSADIVCRDADSERVILIENQLEKTDHSHLGQIFTYAAGVDAVIIVWIAKRFTDEHRAAVDWLNRISGSEFHFFGLEVELWKIGDSPVAPKFNIIAQPNDWAKAVTASIRGGSGELSDLRKSQLAFWTAFADWVDENSTLATRPPKPSPYCGYSIGKTGIWMTGCITTWNSEANKNSPEIRAELVIQTPDAKERFEQLFQEKEAIEAEFGEPLHWDPGENSKRCRIYTRQDGDFADESLWPEQFPWLASQLEKLRDIIGPLAKSS
jgi:hypothetical protein